jgi:hypothetical protein
MRSLVSCSTSEVTPPPADGGTFETLDELKEAVESAGLACQELVLDTPLPSSLPPRQAVASSHRLRSTGMTNTRINIGKKWTLISEDPKLIQKSLGGTVLHTRS